MSSIGIGMPNVVFEQGEEFSSSSIHLLYPCRAVVLVFKAFLPPSATMSRLEGDKHATPPSFEMNPPPNRRVSVV
jgi:hypothetical protein